MKENNWFDPFYIQSHLSEEESNIQKNVRDFCNNELKPRVCLLYTSDAADE